MAAMVEFCHWSEIEFYLSVYPAFQVLLPSSHLSMSVHLHQSFRLEEEGKQKSGCSGAY
jgi:hypothetical protein